MGLPFREVLLHLFKHVWRDRRQMNDRCGLVFVVAAGLLLLFVIGTGFVWLRSGQSLPLFAAGHRHLLFAGYVFAAALLGLGAHWVATDPKRQGRPPLQQQRLSLFSGPAMRLARRTRYLLPLPLVVAGWLVWVNWVALPPCPPHPGTICIRVARFWDPEKQSCDSPESLNAQHALVRAIEVEARTRESLAGRVMVMPVEASVWADDTATGNDRASKLAKRLNADLVVWGSLTQGRGADVYWVSVARGQPAPLLSIEETPQKVMIATDPCPPELGQRPLLLASFVLGYGAIVTADYPSAIRLFETLLSQLGDVGTPRRDEATVSFYLGTSHLALAGTQDRPAHIQPAMRYLERAVTLADGEEMSAGKAAALYNWGLALVGSAQRKEGAEAEHLLGEACAKYEAAVKIKPADHGALSNWGLALQNRAKLKEGAEADRLFGEACDKYEAAVNIKPDFHIGFYNWGNALWGWAQIERGAEADRLFGQACEKYQAAVKIKPDYHEALYNWGVALTEWAKLKEGAEAEGLFRRACKKYEAAVKIKPDYHEALSNWGVALTEWAKLKEGAEAERLFGEACAKYEAAVTIKPDDHVALYNWGVALSDWAKLKEGAEAEGLFGEACDKYQAAVKIKPDYHEALSNWGLALRNWAILKEGAEADRLFGEACDKYQAAVKIKPDYYNALSDWGVALSDWAKLKEGVEAERLFGEACDKYQSAVKIKPDYHEALSNWGAALQIWARRKRAAEAERLLGEACAKYRATVNIEPGYHVAFYNWALALLEWAKLKEGAEAQGLCREAKDRALAAERIKPGAGTYGAACASARLGEDDECRRWLEAGLEHGALQPRSVMERDPNLDSVRETDWFKEILEKAPE